MDKKEIIIKKSRKQKFCGDQHTSKKNIQTYINNNKSQLIIDKVNSKR